MTYLLLNNDSQAPGANVIMYRPTLGIRAPRERYELFSLISQVKSPVGRIYSCTKFVLKSFI